MAFLISRFSAKLMSASCSIKCHWNSMEIHWFCT